MITQSTSTFKAGDRVKLLDYPHNVPRDRVNGHVPGALGTVDSVGPNAAWILVDGTGYAEWCHFFPKLELVPTFTTEVILNEYAID